MPHSSGWFTYVRRGDEKPKKVTRELLLRVLSYGRPYRAHIVGMLFLIAFSSLLTLVTPLIFRRLIDTVLPEKNLEELYLLTLALFVVPLVSGAFTVVQRYLTTSIGEGVIYDLRLALFARLQRMSLHFFTNTRTGELMSRLNNDVTGAQNAISTTITGIITHLIQSVAVLSVMVVMEWRLTLVSVIILPLFILAARRLGAILRVVARKSMDASASMNAHMNETLGIGGALLVKLFGRMADEERRFEGHAVEVRDIAIRRTVLGSIFFVIIGLVSSVGTAMVYGLGGYLVIEGRFTVGNIVALGAYLGTLYTALQGLASAPVQFSTSMVSFERVFEVIDLPHDIRERENPVILDEPRGELEFRDVSFTYQVEEQNLLSEVKRYGEMDRVTATLSGTTSHAEGSPTSQAREVAIQGISFHAKPGNLVALVGASGAGKTTLTYLIPRLYDPSAGSILVDGIDLRDLQLDSLSEMVGMVTQETHLFHDTIRTNLIYAKPDATQQMIEEAAKAAHIHHFIQDLPDGYDTIVGERGYRLSGGEKQRIALARVFLKNPGILVLDEATSHLDSESERLIQNALRTVMEGRTSIVIAHRLSTVLNADQILVMDRGRIVERGTHGELLELGGKYHYLFQTQFGENGGQG